MQGPLELLVHWLSSLVKSGRRLEAIAGRPFPI